MKTILFYPDPLKKDCRMYYPLLELGVPFHNNKTKAYDIAIFWSYAPDYAPQDDFVKNNKFLNKGCHDISKTNVSKWFDEIVIDPEAYNGMVVRKTEKQCDRQEILLKCPTKKEANFVYRKYINTNISGFFVDYRLFYFGKPSFLMAEKNFTGKPIYKGDERIFNIEPLNIIPKNKLIQIETISDQFGFHIGEIDLLRDKDNKWYVIDINNVAGTTVSYKRNKEAQQLYKKYLWEYINDYPV